MTDDEPETWNPEGLVDHFVDVHRKNQDRRFAFVLGAGASVQSGIPAAGALVRRWLGELHRRLGRGPIERWATAASLEIPGFDYAQATASYSHVFARRFRQHPDEGYADLEDIMQGKDPSFGYSVLAHVLAETRHKLVITTNFDNLVADALSIFTATSPLVCGHESLAGFIRVVPRRPVVVKIHRDLLMAPMNLADEIATLPAPWHEPLTHVFRNYTPIVLGYGGNDGSLMGFLDRLPERSIVGGLFWCFYGPGGPPSPQIRRLVARHRGAIVPIDGFDEFMALLQAGLGIGFLDGVIERKAQERVERYRRSAEALFRRSALDTQADAPASVAEDALEAPVSFGADDREDTPSAQERASSLAAPPPPVSSASPGGAPSPAPTLSARPVPSTSPAPTLSARPVPSTSPAPLDPTPVRGSAPQDAAGPSSRPAPSASPAPPQPAMRRTSDAHEAARTIAGSVTSASSAPTLPALRRTSDPIQTARTPSTSRSAPSDSPTPPERARLRSEPQEAARPRTHARNAGLPSLSSAAAPEPATTRLAVEVCGQGRVERHVFTRPSLRIGRGLDNDLVLADPAIAVHHAELRDTPEGFFLVDLESNEGTWIGAMRVPSTGVLLGAPRLVTRLGPFELHVERAPAEIAKVADADDADLAIHEEEAPATPEPEAKAAPETPLQRALQQIAADTPESSAWSALMQARAEPNFDQALAILRTALQRFPDDPHLLAALAARLSERPSGAHVGEAVRILRSLLAREPEVFYPPLIQHDLALLLALMSGIDSAAKNLQDAWHRVAQDLQKNQASHHLMLARLAGVSGLVARLRDRDDTRMLAVFKATCLINGAAPGIRGPLGDSSLVIERLMTRLDPPGHRLYQRLFAVLRGERTLASAEQLEPRLAAIQPADLNNLDVAALA